MNEIQIAERTRDIIARELSRSDEHNAARLVKRFKPETGDFIERDEQERSERERSRRELARQLDEQRFTRALLRIASEINRADDRQAVEQVDKLTDLFGLVYGFTSGMPGTGKIIDEWRQRAREAEK